MIVGHVLGLPVEESVLQLAPAGAAIATALTIAARTVLDRLSGVFRLPNAANAPDTSVPALQKPLHDE